MKPRTRTPGNGPRKQVIPIRFNDEEYELLVKAANLKGILVSTFIANTAMREATKVTKKKD